MLKELTQLEQKYVFRAFNANTAFKLGNYLAKKAMREKLPIVIDISTPTKQYFHFAAEGSTANNENFIRRKRNVVFLFFHSTMWVDEKVKGDSTAMHQKYGTNDQDYSILHGGFPIMIRNQGVVAAFCVSGLTQEEDHALVIEALEWYKKSNQ